MNISESLATGKGVNIGEALSMGGMTTVIGMAIVFAVLVILMLVLVLFRVIFYKAPSNQQPKEKQNEVAPAPVVAEAVEEDEEELIAVLTAAVAASLKTSTYNLHIKSYRRIADSRPSWNREGLRETIGSRF